MYSTSFLRSIPLFEGLEEDDLVALSATLEPRRVGAGSMIFKKGDAGRSMFIVESGSVNIHLPGEAAQRISLMGIWRAASISGRHVLFDDKPRSASALATSNTVLLELQRETLEDFLDHRPRTAKVILRTMGQRLRETNTMLSERAAQNVNEEYDNKISLSDRLADFVAEFNGSWKFILVLIAIIAAWCLVNTSLVMKSPPDPYPYEFFNLVLGIMVGLQGPLIVMSQNRQAFKDRLRADTDFKVNLKNEVNIEGFFCANSASFARRPEWTGSHNATR